MNELQIPKIEKQDIQAPVIQPEGTAIVLQRHERYDRDRSAEGAGSLLPDVIEAAKDRDIEFFQEVLAQETDGAETMVLFASSDTQYADKGRRSLETAEIAKEAAKEVFTAAGIDPTSRILNLSDAFMTKRHEETDQDIRPVTKLREPQIFDDLTYVNFLRDKYGAEDGAGNGISQKAWAAHEMDAEEEVRKEMGAEGVHDILDRTKQSIAIFERYARVFHKLNPGKRLVIWAASHYDTISPLVKDATDTSFEEYVSVDYGAGVVINIEPGSKEPVMSAQGQKVALELGKTVVDKTTA